MGISASRGLTCLGMAAFLAIAPQASAQAPKSDCYACRTGLHASADHQPDLPYMAPVAVEKKRGLVGTVLGRKRYVVPAYHQVKGQEPTPIGRPSMGNPVGTPPAVIQTPPATALAQATPGMAPPYSGHMGMPPTAWGEPAPADVMRTSYDAVGTASGHATTGGPAAGPMASAPAAPAYDPSIAAWHTVMAPGSSMVAGGDKRSFVSRLLSGDLEFDFGDRLAERRQQRRLAKFYRSTGALPYKPGAQSAPSNLIMPGH